MIQMQRSLAAGVPFSKRRSSTTLEPPPPPSLRCRDDVIADLGSAPPKSSRETSADEGLELPRQKRRRLSGGKALEEAAEREEGEAEEAEVERATRFVEVAAACQAVVVVGKTANCCMCHVARKLLCGLGANPKVVEAGSQHSDAALEAALRAASGGAVKAAPPLPAVFIGGRLLGGVDQLLSTHLAGHLIPRLKEAGALWL